jgi:hypothetical protein
MKSPRTTVALLIAIPLAVTIALWIWLFVHTVRAADASGTPLAEGLGLGTLEFSKGFSMGMERFDGIGALYGVLGGARLLVLLAVAVVVLGVWLAARLWTESITGRIFLGLLVTEPLIVGLGLVPSLIFKLYKELAEIGTATPLLVGLGMAEAFYPLLAGGVLSLALLVVFSALLVAPGRGE